MDRLESEILRRAQTDGHDADLVPRPHPRPDDRQDHLRRRQRRRRRDRLGLGRPGLSRPAGLPGASSSSRCSPSWSSASTAGCRSTRPATWPCATARARRSCTPRTWATRRARSTHVRPPERDQPESRTGTTSPRSLTTPAFRPRTRTVDLRGNGDLYTPRSQPRSDPTRRIRDRGFRQRDPASQPSYRHPALSRAGPGPLGLRSTPTGWLTNGLLVFYLPNNLADISDSTSARGGTTINLPPKTVAGRWGEPGGIPRRPRCLGQLVPARVVHQPGPRRQVDCRHEHRQCRQRLARRQFERKRLLAPADGGGIRRSLADRLERGTLTITWPADYYDAAGDTALPAERIRRFVTPIDIAGTGTW